MGSVQRALISAVRTVQLPFAVAVVLALGASDTASAATANETRGYRIVTDTYGGWVTRLGPLDLKHDGLVGEAVAAFGRPSSIKRGSRSDTDGSCRVHWRERHIAATFASGGGVFNPCDPHIGTLASATIRSRAWSTTRGLRVGWSTAQMRRAYPDAKLAKGAWGLVRVSEGGASVAAVPRNGRVAALLVRAVFSGADLVYG